WSSSTSSMAPVHEVPALFTRPPRADAIRRLAVPRRVVTSRRVVATSRPRAGRPPNATGLSRGSNGPHDAVSPSGHLEEGGQPNAGVGPRDQDGAGVHGPATRG